MEDASRAYANVVWGLLDWFKLDEAERYLTAAIRLAEDAEFLGFLSYLRTRSSASPTPGPSINPR